MNFLSHPTHFRVAATALAVAMLAGPVSAQVAIPGLNSPITTAVDAAAPAAPAPAPAPAPAAAASAAQPATAPTPPAAAQATPPERLLRVGVEQSELPAVPASVMPRAQARRPSTPVETRQDVIVANGTNTLIPISRGQINRIVTPFESPEIQTVSDAVIQTRDNVVYVTTTNDQPVTMFITPEDDEGVAISLTLLPQSIPPIQANLLFTQSLAGTPAAAGQHATQPTGAIGYSGQARKWERSQPFMNTLRAMMRELALGNLPQGYTFADLQPGASVPHCYQPGLNYDFSKAQYVLGHDFRIFITVAENTSGQHIEVLHESCTHPHRAAVAMWPHEILEPGQKTEVFLVTRVPKAKADTSTRPSLLN